VYDSLNQMLLQSTKSLSTRTSLNQFIDKTFIELADSVELAADNINLIAVSTINAKVSIQSFCLETMAECLKVIGQVDMSESLMKLSDMMRHDVGRLENIAIVMMKDKIDKVVSLRAEEFERLNNKIEELRTENLEL
jgi:hypothetical protein